MRQPLAHVYVQDKRPKRRELVYSQGRQLVRYAVAQQQIKINCSHVVRIKSHEVTRSFDVPAGTRLRPTS
jgi:hypothetical protein